MTYSYSPTLSQTFDTDDFIQPDIVSVVDQNVRKACEEALARGNLDSDLVRTFKVEASSDAIMINIPEGAVPSLDPDEFIRYEQPEPPEIQDFEIPVYETEAETREIPDMELTGTEIKFDVPVIVPGETYTADLSDKEIIIELPETADVSVGINQVRRDLFKFDERIRKRIQIITIVVIIAVLVFLYYTIFFRIGLIIDHM